MDFKKYNSLENSYRTKFLNKIIEEGHANLEYVVEEKIHGANFSFWMNDVKTVCGKRSGFVPDDENFYGSIAVLKQHYDGLRRLFNWLQAERGAKEVAVFGEIYGGCYPHPEVPKTLNAMRVQGKVWYRPDNAFYGFDLMVDGLYQDEAFTKEMLAQFGIPTAKELFRGNLEECLKYPNAFVTTIPGLLGLPPVADNICEGVVIRPVQATFLWSGERLIIKNKNARFAEKDEPRKLKDTPKALGPESQAVLDLMLSYLTTNRLSNVLSKLGAVTQKDFGKIMGLLNQDTLEDFNKDHMLQYEELTKDEQNRVKKALGQQSALLVRSNFANILDGNF